MVGLNGDAQLEDPVNRIHMISMKSLFLAALLTALSAPALRADLILLESTDSPDSFSAKFEWIPAAGPSTYDSPDGNFWDIHIANGSIVLTVVHALPTSVSMPTGFFATTAFTMGMAVALHPNNGSTHNDVFTLTIVPAPQLPTPPPLPVFIVTLTGHAEPISHSVPEPVSTFMLLGLGIGALGAFRRQ